MLAYLPNRSGQEGVRLLTNVCDNFKHCKKSHYILQSDLETAYDKIKIEYLIELFKKLNFPPIYIARVVKLFSNNVARIFVNNKTLGAIRVTTTLAQGDSFSCVAFIFAILPLCLAFSSKKDTLSYSLFPKKHPNRFFTVQRAYQVYFANFADDSLNFFSNIYDIIPILEIYCGFENSSNLHFNISINRVAVYRNPTYMKYIA